MSVRRGRNSGTGRLSGLLVLAFATVALLAPADASAQAIQPQSWDQDYCAETSPNGKLIAPGGGNSWLNLSFSAAAPGSSVQAEMYRTNATECLQTRPAVCPPNCQLHLRTVCEYHCFHNHVAPQGWTVQLWPSGNAGNFLGWETSPCLAIKEVPQSYCVVQMPQTGSQYATAKFGTEPDTSRPAAPVANVSNVGSYAMTVSWTPSSDDHWLGGYDIYDGSTRLLRVSRGTHSARLEALTCQMTYNIQVAAFDAVGETRSNPVPATTGECLRSSDTTAPNTVFHVKPAKVTRSRTAYFHWGATEASRFRCKLDRGLWTKCKVTDPYVTAMGKTYRRLRVGYHTLRVRAIDRAGNREPVPAVYTWRIRR